MRYRTDEEIIAAINDWQNTPQVHPLTCGNDSNHAVLFPVQQDDGMIVLKCPDCDYVQHYIPNFFMTER